MEFPARKTTAGPIILAGEPAYFPIPFQLYKDVFYPRTLRPGGHRRSKLYGPQRPALLWDTARHRPLAYHARLPERNAGTPVLAAEGVIWRIKFAFLSL